LSHTDEHPEPEEGCRECAHTPRPRTASIEELLSRARLVHPNEKRRPFNEAEGLRRLQEDAARRRGYQTELDSLLALKGPAPDERRRIAELVEALFDREASRQWWEAAALAGDQDAQDYLSVWDEEDDDDSDGFYEVLQQALQQEDFVTKHGLEETRKDIVEMLDQYYKDVEKLRDAKPEDFEEGK
jgi:hypothetical protein